MANCHGLDFFSLKNELHGKLASVKAADGVPAIPSLPDFESVNPIILHPIGRTPPVVPFSVLHPLRLPSFGETAAAEQNRSRQFQLRFYWKRKRRRERGFLVSFRPLLLVTDQRFPRGQKASVAGCPGEHA